MINIYICDGTHRSKVGTSVYLSTIQGALQRFLVQFVHMYFNLWNALIINDIYLQMVNNRIKRGYSGSDMVSSAVLQIFGVSVF